MSETQHQLKHKSTDNEKKDGQIATEEDVPLAKRAKLDSDPTESTISANKHTPNERAPLPETDPNHRSYLQEKHAVITEPAPWISGEIAVTASQYTSEYLKSIPALSIIEERGTDTIISVHADHHISNAMTLMTKENLLSCPVFDKELQAFIGFVDYLDITTLMVSIVRSVMEKEFAGIKLSELTAQQRTSLISLVKLSFNAKTLFDITDLSKLDPFHPVPKSTTLYHAIELLSNSGIHRVPIENDEQKIEAILSQSAVIDFLFGDLDKFPAKAKVLVKDFMGTKSVVTVKESDLACEAFFSMIDKKITAVGVVDEEDKLTGIISSTDIRMIGPHAHSLPTLFHTAKEFFESTRERNEWAVLPVVLTNPDETLGIVIEKMQDNFVHRVFVVDSDHKPISVISMKDVLLQFLKED